MRRPYQFLEPGPGAAIPVRGVLQEPCGELQPQLPELLVESAGHLYQNGLDVTRICHGHHWASLPCPVISGLTPPVCDLCEAERLLIDGHARYRDLVDKRRLGLV